MGLHHPSASFVENAQFLVLATEGAEQSQEKELKMPLQALGSGIHDPNPPAQECCPTLGQKNFCPHEFPNPANPERWGKGSQMETWKEIPLPSLEGQSLKARSLFFKIVCLMLNNQFALHWCYNCLLFTEMWWPHNKPSFIVISSLLLWGGGERTPI